MATGGCRQLTLFQCCTSDSYDVSNDPGTKCVRLVSKSSILHQIWRQKA